MKTLSRYAALLVALFMAVSMAACSAATATPQPSAAGTVAASASAAQSPSAPAQTTTQAPTTLKMLSFSTNPNGTGPMDNMVAKYIEKNVGVIMDLTPTNEEDAQKTLPALVASNDLPDIFFIPETDTMKYINMMFKGGQILALDDLVKQSAPNMMADKSAQAMIELKKKTLSPDGKLYVIGMERGTFDSGMQPIVGQFIRWDLYKQLGYPAMNSLDDLLNVLAQMQKLEPTNKTGQKVYALGAWFGDSQGWGDWHLTYNRAYAEGFTCLTPGDRTVYSDITSNKIVTTDAQKDKNSLFWQEVQFYNKAYQMGILDPDSFTQKGDQYETKLKNGQYLYFNPGWMTDEANSYFQSNGMPDKGFTCLTPIGTDKFTLYRYFIAGQFNYGVAANCKSPDKAMQLIDWVSSYQNDRIIYDGPEGTNWNVVDGKPTPTDDYLKTKIDDPDYQKTQGLDILQKFCGYCYATIDPATGVALDLHSNSDKALAAKVLPVHQDMLAHYGAASLPDLYKSKAPGGYTDQCLYNLGALPDDLQTLDTSLQSYEFQNEFKCILAKTDAEFTAQQDQYIKGLDAFKIDDIFSYWMSVGQKQETDLAPIYDMLK